MTMINCFVEQTASIADMNPSLLHLHQTTDQHYQHHHHQHHDNNHVLMQHQQPQPHHVISNGNYHYLEYGNTNNQHHQQLQNNHSHNQHHIQTSQSLHHHHHQLDSIYPISMFGAADVVQASAAPTSMLDSYDPTVGGLMTSNDLLDSFTFHNLDDLDVGMCTSVSSLHDSLQPSPALETTAMETAQHISRVDILNQVLQTRTNGGGSLTLPTMFRAESMQRNVSHVHEAISPVVTTAAAMAMPCLPTPPIETTTPSVTTFRLQDPATISSSSWGKIKSKDKKDNPIKCNVCGCPSSGFHYGAHTCEACKLFFR
jgi:hypothetical protein